MIGFSIMMWFLGIILMILAISLLKGNSSSMHGKVYETTKDRTRYAKASGKPILFLGIGLIVCGCLALLGSAEEGIKYAAVVLIIIILITFLSFIRIQRKYKSL